MAAGVLGQCVLMRAPGKNLTLTGCVFENLLSSISSFVFFKTFARFFISFSFCFSIDLPLRFQRDLLSVLLLLLDTS